MMTADLWGHYGWRIEQLFKDCKTGGYHLEDAKVNDTRFLALVLLIAFYALSLMQQAL